MLPSSAHVAVYALRLCSLAVAKAESRAHLKGRLVHEVHGHRRPCIQYRTGQAQQRVAAAAAAAALTGAAHHIACHRAPVLLNKLAASLPAGDPVRAAALADVLSAHGRHGAGTLRCCHSPAKPLSLDEGTLEWKAPLARESQLASVARWDRAGRQPLPPRHNHTAAAVVLFSAHT